MSSLACEAQIVVDGPLPVERAHSLLTVPGVVVPQDELEAHWEQGVIVWGYPEEVAADWEGGSEGTFRVKAEGGVFPQGTFTTFILYVPVSCTASGMTPEEFSERAARVLRVTQAFGVERALAQGVSGLSNPFMGDGNLTLLTGAAVPPQVGVAYLEEAIAATGRGGMIHITPSVAASLMPVAVMDDPIAPLYTGAGTPIAVGAGYAGTVPTGEGAPGTTEDYIFATGPVKVRVDEDVDLPDIRDALDRLNNDVTFRAEKYAVVSWDTALQAAALVDWST